MKLVLFLATLLVVSVIPFSFSETITINTNKEQFAGGDTVEINGNVENGNAGEFVALEIKNPDGETILIRTVTLGDGGSFYLKFKIPESGKAGSYNIVANSQQAGQTVTQTKTITQSNSVESPPLESKPKGGGCLIATATYGSELAPQVQQLRELRDNNLLQTESGTTFMSTFNQFYYSFSPTIADWERESPIFKEAVKITLTPLISSLSILNYVDMDSEVSVLGYGISLILLNVGMYFVAPAIVIVGIKNKL
ncbi:CFI-box-CTERM domain-containing protein [Nitrosarchaeum sp. AC2]|uniref:CFI-box-CTERM domain-containing protein n=1 Tax=Nitrosarchaeum sp. AC2 TaxID=2259673 RepID=UPI002107DE81|nr:CFI-box-CTERM domain-containing protein [Nitrosarchaeum sp. AC2]